MPEGPRVSLRRPVGNAIPGPEGDEATEVLREMARLIGRLRHGCIVIHVEEGRITQIEATEKKRLV